MTLDLDTLVLRSGTHTSSSDGVSLMEAVSALAGEPWSNSPSCNSVPGGLRRPLASTRRSRRSFARHLN
jgi:hypothetical protein